MSGAPADDSRETTFDTKLIPEDTSRAENDGLDSTCGAENYTITSSLASSAKDFRHVNGRRYHAFDADAYFIPNDEIEAARLDLQHHIWKITFDDASGRVPITPTVKNVLDVGTGTGVWAIEFADAHPETHVIGTDLSPMQSSSVPPNCHFTVGNAEHDFAFDCQFDYIQARMLTLGMHDWRRFFQQCFDALAPGGWLETAETVFPGGYAEGTEDGEETHFMRWGRYLYEAAGKAGIDARASEGFTEMLEARGFVNVDRVNVQWPVTPWAKGRKNKLLGRLLWDNTQKAIPGLSNLLFTKHLGWTKEEVDLFCEETVEESRTGRFYYHMVLHRAQKPQTASV